jgi:CubicO group peptidase (beta-lactamase class C family)
MTRCRRTFLVDAGRAALGFGALWSSGCSSSTSNIAKDPFLQSLVTAWEAGIPQWLPETKMPAVSVSIIRDGQLAWQRAFGVKDTGTNEPVDADTVFAACSNTKPVFAYGVLKLCEKGVLSLDTPLTRYTTRRITTDPRIELVTARHVLNHTTGFPNWRQGKELPIEFDPDKDAVNIARRGISFTAAEAMFDGFVVEEVDDRFDYGEERIVALGEIAGRVFCCIYTWRGNVRRVISLRQASQKERIDYANVKGDQG